MPWSRTRTSSGTTWRNTASASSLPLLAWRSWRAFLGEIEALDAQRADAKGGFAETFRAQLDVEIVSLECKIELYGQRPALMRSITGRKETLARQGNAAQSAADEDALRISNLGFEPAERLSRTRVRRQAADRGVFINQDGEDPPWVLESRMEPRLEKKRTRLEIGQAQAEPGQARTYLEATPALSPPPAPSCRRSGPRALQWPWIQARIGLNFGATSKPDRRPAQQRPAVQMRRIAVSESEESRRLKRGD